MFAVRWRAGRADAGAKESVDATQGRKTGEHGNCGSELGADRARDTSEPIEERLGSHRDRAPAQ